MNNNNNKDLKCSYFVEYFKSFFLVKRLYSFKIKWNML